MTEIERLARLVVWRGVGYAALAIATALSGLLFDPGLALKVGAALTLLLGLALYWLAVTCHRRKPTDTEVWYLLPPERRPERPRAGLLIGRAMRAELLQKAGYALWCAIGLIAAATLEAALGAA